MEAARGHPVVVAETFVHPARFKGACYLASNWTALGETRGYARAGGGWTAHGAPKRVFALAGDARAALSGLDEPASWGAGCGRPAPTAEQRLRSLYDFLREVPECRAASGIGWRPCWRSPWRPSSPAPRASPR